MKELCKTNYNLLLIGVFKKGLSVGQVSKDEIVAWADDIILSTETIPDDFVTEISLSNNTNTLAEVLYQYTTYDNAICIRVLFGRIFHRLVDGNDNLTVEEAICLISQLQGHEFLSNFESTYIYLFEDHELYFDDTELEVALRNFLHIYSSFKFDNYEEWIEINKHVEEKIKIKEEKEAAIAESNRQIWERKEAKRKLKRNIIIGFLSVFVICIIAFIIHASPRKFQATEFDFTPLFCLILGIFISWARKRYS